MFGFRNFTQFFSVINLNKPWMSGLKVGMIIYRGPP